MLDFVPGENEIEAWQSLVHVCRRWRTVVFASPRRLNLRLLGTSRRRVRDMLDVWPALPFVIRDYAFLSKGVDNIIASLEHGNRVCQIILLGVPGLDMERILAAMQKPFPEMMHLELHTYGQTVPVFPDSFLAASLQFFLLDGIPFPGIPNLLSSATHLVQLRLWDIPHAGYISPEVVVTALSTLSTLEEFLPWIPIPSVSPWPGKPTSTPNMLCPLRSHSILLQGGH